MDKTFAEEPSVLREFDTYWLIQKPSGWLVHPQRGVDAPALTDWVGQFLGQRRVFPVHRLDRGTSGIMLWAKDSKGARTWQEAWQSGKVRKGYVALVRGRVEGTHYLDHPVPGDEGGERKPAQSMLRAMATVTATPRDLSLLEVEPYTGRFHQIRRHVKHLGHPLIGDSNYGRTELNRAYRQSVGLARLALHAAWLQVPDLAFSERSSMYFAPMPDSLRTPLLRLGFEKGRLEMEKLRLFLTPRCPVDSHPCESH